VRCPKCHATIGATETPPSGREIRRGKAGSLGLAGVCPICQVDVDPEEFVLACPACHQLHHQDCWSEVGGCATYGCTEAPAEADKPPEAADAPRSAWGDYKNCPMCGEQIPSIALKCRFCGTNFDSVDPLTVADLHKKVYKSDDLRTAGKSVIALFILSLIGCLAPIMAVVSLVWILPRRATLAKAGPFYLVLGYTSIVISLLYSLLMLLFGIASMAN